MKILSISTATSNLSVALNNDEEVVSEINEENGRNHSVNLDPDIQKLLDQEGITLNDVDRFAVAEGPGSYTGLRVGMTTAKMLASILNKELVGVSTLEALTLNFSKKDAVIVAALDARNMNFFAGVYKNKRCIIKDGHYFLDDLLKQIAQLNSSEIIFVGSDFAKYQETIKQNLSKSQVTFAQGDQNILHAGAIGRLAFNAKPVDPDKLVPKYLRRTQAEYDWAKKTGQNFAPDSEYVEEV